jgi:hypothetical protein
MKKFGGTGRVKRITTAFSSHQRPAGEKTPWRWTDRCFPDEILSFSLSLSLAHTTKMKQSIKNTAFAGN